MQVHSSRFTVVVLNVNCELREHRATQLVIEVNSLRKFRSFALTRSTQITTFEEISDQ